MVSLRRMAVGLATLGSGAAVGTVRCVDVGLVLDVVVGATVGPVVPWQNISRRWALARSWSSVVALGAPLIALVRARKLWMMWSSVVSVGATSVGCRKRTVSETAMAWESLRSNMKHR